MNNLIFGWKIGVAIGEEWRSSMARRMRNENNEWVFYTVAIEIRFVFCKLLSTSSGLL